MTQHDIIDRANRIHFIGIGGSGMSPIAEILHSLGKTISGSDVYESDNVVRMRSLNIPVHIGHSADLITPDIDLVVYTIAVGTDNPELLEANAKQIPTIERGKLLGLLTGRFARSLAVAGTHGKTTTTSMISQILLQSGLDPSLYIGGRLPLINANGRAGKSDIMVFEACEFQNHYLEMTYNTAVILNVDADHLDFFGTLDNVIQSFHTFASRAGSTIIVNNDDAGAMKAVENIQGKTILRYGTDPSCHWQARNIRFERGSFAVFDIYHEGAFFSEVKLNVPGRHNVGNALAAAAASYLHGADAAQIAQGLSDFHGAGRRFEFLGTKNGITVADDYAHHPTEITATLQAAKAMDYNRVIAVFQPFTFTRTARHLEEFAQALSIADLAIVSDIMGSREQNTLGVSSQQIVEKMRNGVYLATFEEIVDYLLPRLHAGDLVLTMGGGNVYQCARMLWAKLS